MILHTLSQLPSLARRSLVQVVSDSGHVVGRKQDKKKKISRSSSEGLPFACERDIRSMASLAPSAALEAVFLRSYVGWLAPAAGFGPTQTVQTSFRALITYGSMTDSAASGRAGRRVRERAQETLIRMVVVLCLWQLRAQAQT